MKINLRRKKIIDSMRFDARMSFSNISRDNKIPVATVFDNYNYLKDHAIIKRHISQIDFESLGFIYRVLILLKSKHEFFLERISVNNNVNSIFSLNDSYYLIDCIFKKPEDADSFFQADILTYCANAKLFSFVSCLKFEEMTLSN